MIKRLPRFVKSKFCNFEISAILFIWIFHHRLDVEPQNPSTTSRQGARRREGCYERGDGEPEKQSGRALPFVEDDGAQRLEVLHWPLFSTWVEADDCIVRGRAYGPLADAKSPAGFVSHQLDLTCFFARVTFYMSLPQCLMSLLQC